MQPLDWCIVVRPVGADGAGDAEWGLRVRAKPDTGRALAGFTCVNWLLDLSAPLVNLPAEDADWEHGMMLPMLLDAGPLYAPSPQLGDVNVVVQLSIFVK